MMSSLRLIAKSTIDSDDFNLNSIHTQHLRRIVNIFSKPSFRKLVNVPNEILHLIRHKAGSSSNGLIFDLESFAFIQFITEEVIPDDLLQAFIMSETSPTYRPELLPILHRVLERGTVLGNELSASLLKIKRARQRYDQSMDSPNNDIEANPLRGIWDRLAEGTLTIEK